MSVPDEATSGKYDEPRPFVPGYVKWSIPVYYQNAGHSHKCTFATVLQMSDLARDGVTISTSKGDASVTLPMGTPPP